MKPNESTFTISSIEELDKLVEFTVNILKENNVPEQVGYIVHTVVDEVALNFLNYGCPNSSIEAIFITNIECKANEVVVKFTDNGIKFNPLEYPAPADMNLPLEERSIGGWGIHIVKHFADELLYQYSAHKNYLTFVKKW